MADEGSTNVPSFVDRDAPAGASYMYLLRAYNYHQSFTDTQFAVNIPPAGSFDPRQVGIRPAGVYWGGGGEQIDMQSGNLNYTMPILQAKSRGGANVPFALNFNSQMWRRDLTTNGIWYYGRITGIRIFFSSVFIRVYPWPTKFIRGQPNVPLPTANEIPANAKTPFLQVENLYLLYFQQTPPRLARTRQTRMPP